MLDGRQYRLSSLEECHIDSPVARADIFNWLASECPNLSVEID